jgi:hypothetical protein
VSKSPAWRAVIERERQQQRKRVGTVAFTPKLERVTGCDSENPLDKLIREQDADAEPSPLEFGPKRGRVFVRRR